MTGETYIFENIRQTERGKALIALAQAKAIEAKREQEVKEGKLKKRISFNPDLKLTSIHYYV